MLRNVWFVSFDQIVSDFGWLRVTNLEVIFVSFALHNMSDNTDEFNDCRTVQFSDLFVELAPRFVCVHTATFKSGPEVVNK